ncbi:8025_t:CDS:2, partial [Dentiscutata erythropus]
MEILKIVEEFFTLNKIKVNVSKSELIIINGSKENKINGVNFINDTIIPAKPSEAVRYLGIWLQENGKKIYQKKLIEEKVSKTTTTMIRKQLTDKQSRYIINHVLFSQIEYLLMDYVYPEKELEKINARIRMVFRRSCGYTSKLPNSVLYAAIGYKLFCLHKRQLQLHSTELINRINKVDRCGWTTKDYMWTIKSIWSAETINKYKARNHNLTGEILKLLAKNDIEICMNGTIDFPIKLGNGIIDIESFMESETWYYKHRDSLRKYGILYIEQLLNADLSKILELKRIHQYEIPRRNVTWYPELKKKIEENLNYIREKITNNSINRLSIIGTENKLKGTLVTIKHSSGPIIGKITWEPKTKDQKIIMQHYIQEESQGTLQSPLAACSGCSLKETISNTNNTDITYCSITANIAEKSQLPIRNSKFSIGNQNDNRQKMRMVISPNSLNIYHNNIPTRVNYKSIRNNIDDSTFLKNIIATDSQTLEYLE